MSTFKSEADKMLDAYIYDYLMKKQLHATARTFRAEGKVSKDIAIDAPDGFLCEWWSVFWDLFMAWNDLSSSEEAVSYLKIQQIKAREMWRQRGLEKIQFLDQSPAQQHQHEGGTPVVSGSASCPISNDPLMRQNWAASNTMATKIRENRLKPSLGANALDDVTIKQKEANNVGQHLSMDHTSLLNAVKAIAGGQASGQTLLSAPSILQGIPQKFQSQNQQLPGSTEGMDRLRAGLLQQSNLTQSSQSFNQFLQWQQLMLQAHKILVNPSDTDFESQRLRVLLNNQNMGPRKDGQSNSIGDSIPNILTPAQFGFPILPHLDSDIFLKHEKSIQQLQQYSQHSLSSQKSHSLPRLDESTTVDGSVSSSQKGNDQASKSQLERKRKRKSESSPSTSSPSTPSTQTSRPTLQHNVPSSKPIFDTYDLSLLTSTQNQLADMDHFMGDNIEPFSSPADADHKGRVDKGFSFEEIKHIKASSCKVDCCHFSSDGKLFATGGHDKKASLWCTKSFNLKSTLEKHTQWITDVRVCPSMLRVATSSADKTVRVWDADNPGYSLRTFTGHTTTVMSLDFHPTINNLICSCDNTEIKYWNIRKGECAGVYKGGATQMRFQPCFGKLLAVAADNLISILDVETMTCRLKLQGHKNLVHSVFWAPSGNFLASVSDDQVRIWEVGSGSNGECSHELHASATWNKFKTCAFHPLYPVVVIGCIETIVLWDFIENKIMRLHAHDKLVSALAVSDVTGLVASVSHDKHFNMSCVIQTPRIDTQSTTG